MLSLVLLFAALALCRAAGPASNSSRSMHALDEAAAWSVRSHIEGLRAELSPAREELRRKMAELDARDAELAGLARDERGWRRASAELYGRAARLSDIAEWRAGTWTAMHEAVTLILRAAPTVAVHLELHASAAGRAALAALGTERGAPLLALARDGGCVPAADAADRCDVWIRATVGELPAGQRVDLFIGASRDDALRKLREAGVDPSDPDVVVRVATAPGGAGRAVVVADVGGGLLERDGVGAAHSWLNARSAALSGALQFAEWMEAHVCGRLDAARSVYGTAWLHRASLRGRFEQPRCAAVGVLCSAGLGFCAEGGPRAARPADALDRARAAAIADDPSLVEYALRLLVEP